MREENRKTGTGRRSGKPRAELRVGPCTRNAHCQRGEGASVGGGICQVFTIVEDS